jgi:hypothetical protein
MMDDEQIAALAKGMVPFVRQCVAEAFGKATVPSELAAQVASAVRLLHESPPLAQRSEPPRPSPKVARIERDEDGNFVPVYDDQSV